jgi:nitroreductase
MELFEAIRTRRSIRRFSDKPITEDLLEQILSAAMMAPSAGNGQPWQFILVTERALLDKIAENHPNAGMSREATAGVVVCGDTSIEKYAGNWPADCAAATQNLLLAVHALGLGGVWTAVHPNEGRCAAFRKLFGLPETVIPLAFVPIGYPAEQRESAGRYKPERVHRNGW